jgi:hypothetical protein
MIMILTDDEIRIAAQSWVGLTDAPNPNATSFAAGAKFGLQKLQQTQCTTQLELLQQMLNEEQIAYMQSKNSMEVDMRLYNEDALKAVIKLINARQPIA